MNTETAAPAATRRQHIADTIYSAVEAAPMSFVADGGYTADRLAAHLDEQAQRESLTRADQILKDLHATLRTGNAQVTQQTIRARMLGDTHSGDYCEGRARGYADALAAVRDAQAALHGIKPGNSRQENAQAFAEAIINGHTAKDTQ